MERFKKISWKVWRIADLLIAIVFTLALLFLIAYTEEKDEQAGLAIIADHDVRVEHKSIALNRNTSSSEEWTLQAA